MAVCEDKLRPASSSDAGALLYVADFVNDSHDVLDFACELAEMSDVHLELLHVIDPDQTPSRPDAQMGVQYNLETLASSLGNLKRNARALLLFGHPGDVISKRAAEARAILIAFPASGTAYNQAQKSLVKHLTRLCTCPVLMFSPFSVMEMRNSSRCKVALH